MPLFLVQNKLLRQRLKIMVIFELIMHNALVIIGLPFFLLYGMILFKLSKLFKRFGYSPAPYWVIAIVVIAIGAAANYLLWFLLPGLL